MYFIDKLPLDFKNNRSKLNQLKILICEDERLIALDLKNSLQKMGHVVIDVCHNGSELIQRAKDLDPQLIITDISLKGEISGIDAVKVIKDDKNIPFMFLSGLKDDITFKDAMETGPCAFISKPFNYFELKKKIEDCNLSINKKFEPKIKSLLM
jgi:CheY-like chemotaxis protein